MYGCESWTIKKAECGRIDAFELWCWRRLLQVSWAASRSNQSILKEISPGCSLEGMMLKLKLHYLAKWCEELTHLKRPWCWERLKAGGEGDNRGWDTWVASPTQWTWVWAIPGDGEGQGSWSATVHGVTKSETWLSDWTTKMTTWKLVCVCAKFLLSSPALCNTMDCTHQAPLSMRFSR